MREPGNQAVGPRGWAWKLWPESDRLEDSDVSLHQTRKGTQKPSRQTSCLTRINNRMTQKKISRPPESTRIQRLRPMRTYIPSNRYSECNITLRHEVVAQRDNSAHVPTCSVKLYSRHTTKRRYVLRQNEEYRRIESSDTRNFHQISKTYQWVRPYMR